MQISRIEGYTLGFGGSVKVILVFETCCFDLIVRVGAGAAASEAFVVSIRLVNFVALKAISLPQERRGN